MDKKKIEKLYNSKIKELIRLNKFYYEQSKPLVKDSEYDTTIYAEEALHRLVEVYYRIGLVEEAEKYAVVLGYNYQSSIWYQKTYSLFDKKYEIVTKKKLSENKKKSSKILKKFKSLFE